MQKSVETWFIKLDDINSTKGDIENKITERRASFSPNIGGQFYREGCMKRKQAED